MAETLKQTGFKFVYTNTAGEIIYTNGVQDTDYKKATELSADDLKGSTNHSFKDGTGQKIDIVKDKDGNLIGIYDARGKAVKLSDEQMAAIAQSFNLKTLKMTTQKEGDGKKKGEKPGVVSWAERQQKWFDDLGVLGSVAGHALLGPVKFFGNVLTGNFSEVLSMDTLKWLGSTGLVVGAGWGISSALKDDNTSSGNVAGAATDLVSKTSGVSLEGTLNDAFSGNTSQKNNTTGSATAALANTGAQKVNPDDIQKQVQAQQQTQRS